VQALLAQQETSVLQQGVQSLLWTYILAWRKIMGDVVQFKRPKTSERHKGNTLCRSGFHKWEVVNEKRFDVKQGKLITVYQCKRCGKIKCKAL
jgi:hypothetical protein